VGKGRSECSLGNFSSLAGSLGLGLLLLGVGGEELLVLLDTGASILVAVDGLALDEVLAAETSLGDHALNVGGLVESLVSTLDLTGNDVLADIILLLVESEGLDDVVATLGAESVGALDIGDTFNLLVSTLDNTEEDSGEVGVEDAATD
jgi:hypothetical protein